MVTSALLLLAINVGQPEFRPDPAWKSLGNALWFDKAGNRLVLRGRICLREGALEHLICRSRTKEHEAIIATDAQPKLIHAGLLLTGAKVGRPVSYTPTFTSPTGTKILIEVEWEKDGKLQKVPARDWVMDLQKKPLTLDWVFAGSTQYTDPETKKVYYGADDGDLATVVNFETSLLDLPIKSTDSDEARSFQANPSVIPPLETPVTIYLTPVKATAPVKPKT